MIGRAYYNEWDPYAAQWLRNLISAGHIAPGDVDERSIVDVRADDVRGYTQCHFFAGIGGWSYALRLAGWPDDRPVWTGSCPCQPFSAAGKGKAGDDERHLWPRWFSLIKECGPAIVFGEQVEAAIGWGWLDLVFADLEGEGYACGAAVLPACSVGAPHIRQRLWFVADSESARGWSNAGAIPSGAREGLRNAQRKNVGRPLQPHGDAIDCGSNGELADAESGERGLSVRPEQKQNIESRGGGEAGELADDTITRRNEQPQRNGGADGRPAPEPRRLRDVGELGNASGARLSERISDGRIQRRALEPSARQAIERGSNTHPWRDLQWLPCTDGKARPTQPGIFPLAHGVSARVGKLRAAGNAIVPQVAAQFIRAAGGT